jgi:hypothetical protein
MASAAAAIEAAGQDLIQALSLKKPTRIESLAYALYSRASKGRLPAPLATKIGASLATACPAALAAVAGSALPAAMCAYLGSAAAAGGGGRGRPAQAEAWGRCWGALRELLLAADAVGAAEGGAAALRRQLPPALVQSGLEGVEAALRAWEGAAVAGGARACAQAVVSHLQLALKGGGAGQAERGWPAGGWRQVGVAWPGRLAWCVAACLASRWPRRQRSHGPPRWPQCARTGSPRQPAATSHSGAPPGSGSSGRGRGGASTGCQEAQGGAAAGGRGR